MREKVVNCIVVYQVVSIAWIGIYVENVLMAIIWYIKLMYVWDVKIVAKPVPLIGHIYVCPVFLVMFWLILFVKNVMKAVFNA